MGTPITKTYRVRINTTNLVAAAPADGFIDHITLQEYIKAGSVPSSLANAQAKARANLRYLKMIWFLNENNSITYMYNFDNGSATVDTNGSYFEFTLVYEREDAIYTYNELYGTGHPSGPYRILTLEDAIKRQIARVWINDFTSNFYWPYDPSSPEGAQWKDENITAAAPVTAGSLETKITTAENSIIVTQISGT